MVSNKSRNIESFKILKSLETDFQKINFKSKCQKLHIVYRILRNIQLIIKHNEYYGMSENYGNWHTKDLSIRDVM